MRRVVFVRALTCAAIVSIVSVADADSVRLLGKDGTRPERPLAAATVPEGHPRLFADERGFAALKRRLGTDPSFDAAAEIVKACAAEELKSDPLERKMDGRRLLRTCREALRRISVLAMAYRLTGERPYLDRCVKELKAACGFTDWNPSHFLDVAEMSLAVATGYDWLYGDLTPEDRETIAQGLFRHGYEPCLKGRKAGKGKPATQYHPSLYARTNWGQVCNCGMIAAVLALRERIGAEKADELVRGAVERLKTPMSVYAPNGCYPEGPGYWNYGTDFNVLALEMVRSAYGTDWGLSDLPGFRETGAYLDRVCGPTGLYFNYSDSGLRRGSSISPWWFARRFNAPELTAGWERTALMDMAKRGRKGIDRTFPYLLFWLTDPGSATKQALSLTWQSEGVSQLAVQRSGWGKDDVFFAIKAGTPRANHGHMDVGSFVLDAAGVRWAWDLGAEGYGRIEAMGLRLWSMVQDSDRWTIYRLNNMSHNTLTVDGQRQLVAGMGRVVSLTDGAQSESRLDLSAVAENVCTNWIRGCKLLPDGRGLVLADRMAGLKPGAKVRWAMMTKANAEVDGDVLHLTYGGKRLDLVQQGPLKGAWEILKAGTENPQDSANGGFRQVAFTVPAPEDGLAKIRVRFDLRN